jgi:putative inorganic carbon (HCO3(-)) transporter
VPPLSGQSFVARGRAVPANGRALPGRRVLAKPVGVDPQSPSLASPLFSLSLRGLWHFVMRQPASFKLVCLYLFMEYVRPQQIYPTIAGPPYSKFIIGFALIAFFMEGRSFRLGLPEAVLGLFTAIVLASSFLAISPEASYAEISVYLSWVLIYLLIANTVDTEERFLVFVLSFVVWSFKMAQFGTRSWITDGFHFRAWGINGAPGWFTNSGEFAIQMVVFLGVVVYFTRSLSPQWSRWKKYLFWSMPICAVIDIIGSSSRGALVGLAAVALWMLLKSPYKFRGLAATAVLAASVYWLLPPEQMARLQTMGDDGTSVSRTTLWARGIDLMRDNPVHGIGYNNWSPYMESHYGSPLLPHNIFVQAGAELGYTGLLAFVALIILTLAINFRTRRLTRQLPRGNRFLFDMAHGLDAALIGYLVCGFFVTVLYYPFFWINFAMTVALYNAAVNKVRQTGPATTANPRRRASSGGQLMRRLRVPAQRGTQAELLLRRASGGSRP